MDALGCPGPIGKGFPSGPADCIFKGLNQILVPVGIAGAVRLIGKVYYSPLSIASRRDGGIIRLFLPAGLLSAGQASGAPYIEGYGYPKHADDSQ